MKLLLYFFFFTFPFFFSHARVSSTLMDTCRGLNEEIVRRSDLSYVCGCKEGFIRENNICTRGQCDPGYQRTTTGGCAYTKCSPMDALTGKKCIGSTNSPVEDEDIESLEGTYESCDYVATVTTRIVQSNPEKVKQAQASSANKCPDLSLITSARTKGGCGVVDKRCSADIRCIPKRIGGDFGINLPPVEFTVTCSTVNGRCPPNAMDCARNNDLTVSPSPTPSTDDSDIRDTLRSIMDSGAGVH